MNVTLPKSEFKNYTAKIQITGSKSESNRLLILQALFPNLNIENLSNSDDTKVLQAALLATANTIDIHHAGTAMRFLTAYFAIRKGVEVVLTGSERMKQRPIAILVDALNHLGADITYLETHGCPPLLIKGKTLSKTKVTLKANVSSQYISALMLIAPRLEQGLNLTLEGHITSMPYLKMTLDLLQQIDVETTFENQVISVKPLKLLKAPKTIVVESDWSSASYFYSIIALSPIGSSVQLASYKPKSLQGDAVLEALFTSFGVETIFEKQSIRIKKIQDVQENHFECDLNNTPDLAQTIAVTCLGLNVQCHLTGLHTLKIKETDRLMALKNELEKLGAQVHITDDSIKIQPSSNLNSGMSIATYNDHRMAMAFAPLGLKTSLTIEDFMVVSKSYPTFWKDLERLGINYFK